MSRATPRWAAWLFAALPAADRDEMRHDLLELYGERRRRSGRVSAAAWLWWHTVRAAVTLRTDSVWTKGSAMRGLALDVRHVLRGLRASRGFTAVAVLSLAIGIGANAAIFSVIRALLLDEMAVPAPHELSLVYWHHPGELKVSAMMSSGSRHPQSGLQMRSNYDFPLVQALKTSAPPGVEAFAFNFLMGLNVAFDRRPATVAGGLAADAGYFRILAPPMWIGRGISDADDHESAPPVVVLSYPMFMRSFGGDPSALGSVIRVNGVPAQIIGVTAPSFRGLSKGGFFPQTEVTVPLRLVPRVQPNWAKTQPLFGSGAPHWLRVMARFTDESRTQEAVSRWEAAMAPLVAALAPGDARPPQVILLPGSRGLDQTSAETRRLLYILMGVVGIVLLLACVNLASMMLARGAARQREWHVRRALGAGRWRLIRAQLVEGVVLAVAGAAGGLLLTFWGRAVLTTLLTAGLGTAPLSRQPLEVSVDGWLLAGTLVVAVIAALLFSLLPAWRLTRLHTHDLRTQVVGAATPKMTMGRGLVAVQVAITVPLLVCAVLFLRTVANLGAIDLGFDPEGITYFKVNPAPLASDMPGQAAVYARVMDEVRRIPGVTAVTLMENALLSGITSSNNVDVQGRKANLWINAIGPDFLDVVGLRLIAGRMPELRDDPSRPLVGVLNQAAAKKLFGDQSPIGQVVQQGSLPIQIIGVVSDAVYDRPRDAVRPTMYPSAMQRPGFSGHAVTVKSALPAGQLEPALRQAVAQVSRDLPEPEIKTQVQQFRETTMRERVFAQLLSLFGVFALLLACIGLHGVTSYSVARRTNEIGVRMALGAEPSQVLWLILRQVAVLAAIGLAAGVPLALWVAPLFGTLLFKVTPTDPTGLLAGGVVMLIVALAAGWLPARRAARLDPLKALRCE
jgi:predicted permease